MRLLYLLVVAGCLGPSLAAAADDQQGVEFFEKKIRPVLVKHCYACHSSQAEKANKLQGGLRLDSREGIAAGGDSGAVIVPGDARASGLMSALRYEDYKMPPQGKLPPQVVADFEKWIARGAPDPRESLTSENAATTPRINQDHWSFQPLRPPNPPTMGETAWPLTDIDQFILARLKKQKLVPVADAAPHILARRLYFDLIGLPPSLGQLDHFLAAYEQDRSSAIEALVDELLASKHFGERWGRHWLDLVRYSETNGGDRNVIWPHAWRYRNYVIDSFNADKNFGQFIREQIAGDLLPAASREQRDEQIVATGMLTMGPKLFMETKSDRFKMDLIDEQMDVVGRSVLGLTISCARCHDHKFDSISTAEYYGLAGIFRGTYLLYGTAAPAGNQYGHDRPLKPIGKDCEKLQGPAEAWKEDVAKQTAARNKARSDRYRVVRNKAAQENKLKMLTKGKSAEQQSADEAIGKLKAAIEQLAAEIADWDEKIKKLDVQLKQTTDNPPPLPDYAMAVREADQTGDCHIRLRGEYNRKGELAPRGFLGSIPHQPAIIPAGASGRLQLAHWLTDPANPLTARVAVNRVWQHLFGEGIVRSVNNLGVMGERPSHPWLLDFLAVKFQQDDWSTKRLIRRIVLSRAYQMSSRYHADNYSRDPDNRFFWRANRRRLEAEPLRDALLAVGDSLDLQRPASSVIATEFAGQRELNATVKMTPEQLGGRHRSVYLPVARMSLPSELKIWNFPDPSLVVGRRSDRPIADQQLFFLNSPLVIEQARRLAERLLARHGEDSQRLNHAWRRLFARLPSDVERSQAIRYLEQFQKVTVSDKTTADKTAADKTAADETAAWSMLCQALLATAEFRYLE